MNRSLALAAVTLCALLGLLATVAAKERKPPLPSVTGPAVRITVRTTPRVRAEVRWGRKLLGEAPLTFDRPQDSGPMDLVLSAPGYLTIRTRVYTFIDDSLSVTMTRDADRASLFGYRREPPDAGVPDAAADAGIP